MQGGEVMVNANKLPVSGDTAAMFESMDYGAVEAKDLLIPKILLMQGQSEKVLDETCRPDDIVRSTTGEILGSAREKDAKSIRFVPIFMYKTWVKQEVLGKGKMQYVETYPVTPMNTSQKWDETVEVDGVMRTFKNTKNINFYVILEEDFGNALAVPHVLTFRSTSSKAADIIESWFAECSVAQRARQAKSAKGQLMLPFAKIFELGGKLESNEDNSWYVLKTKECGTVDEGSELLEQMFNWYKVVSKYDHLTKVDNSEDTGSASEAKEQVKF